MKKRKKKRPERRPDGPPPRYSRNRMEREQEGIRLNKFIAHSGFCSRRDADLLIEQGEVVVNGKRITTHGAKVKADDRVEVSGQRITLEPFVYLLLNKAKDTISTTDDERDRNTVLDAVENETGFRIYPVGRLDRDTMGLILLTNDGDLAHRLMHPSYRVRKVYEVATSRPLSDQELSRLGAGIELEDGPARPHRLVRSHVDPSVLEITLFEGRNHLVRRMISHFGAEVVRLKRTRYAGLTDKDLRVGRWRYLRRKEINDLRKLVKLNPLEFRKEEA